MTGSRSDDALAEAVAALASWLDASRVPYAVIGGVAVALQAVARFTEDVDAVVWIDDARWSELVESAVAFSITPRRPDALDFARRTRVLLMTHDNGVPIDISMGALPFEERIVQDASPVDVGGVLIKVATPEHLLVLKAIANRPRDHGDIETLLRAFPDLDTTHAREIVREFAQALDAPELLDEFDRLLRKRR